jgi:aryl-alcohol dehydrogenase
MEATAAVLRGGHDPFTIETLTVEEPRADEVLVRMVAAGMCHTDLLGRELPPEFFAGPQVYGHEGAGVVEAVGEAVTHVVPGDHVVLSFNSCGSCPACDAARAACCFDFGAHSMSGGRPDGSKAFTDANGEAVGSHYFGQSSFASLSVAAARSVVKVDPNLNLANLGPLGCGVQTGAGAVMNSLAVGAGQSLVVAGAGALGLSAVMAAKVVGASEIIAIDRHANRLELAERFGATSTISVAPDELAGAIQAATGGGADFAFDTTGNADVVKGCIGGLNNIGTIGLAGVGFGELTIDYLSMISGRKIMGIMEGDAVPETFIPHLAQLNADGLFPFDELIKTFPLAEINAAEAASASGEVIKPVLVF